MVSLFNSLGHVWNVHGKNVTPMTNEDVYELIRDNVCDDAAEYFRERTDVETVLDDLCLTDEDILNNYCSGECEKVQDVQGHYENLLKECGEFAREIYNTIIEGWNPETRRTKKEQFAIDKANQIMNLVNHNT